MCAKPNFAVPGWRQQGVVCLPGSEFGRPGYLRLAYLAVGETAILLTPPLPSLLKHLLKVEGGAAE